MFDVIRVTARDTDNYNYLIRKGDTVLWVDPLYPRKLLKLIEREGLQLAGILVTHTHWDHIDGIAQVRETHDVPVYVHAAGEQDIDEADIVTVREGDRIELGDESLSVYEVPGHHPAHLLFHGGGVAILGDLLFEAGCGSPLFGGEVTQIYASLQRLPAILHDEDRLLWGHNYDRNNLDFAHTYWPDDLAISELRKHRSSLDAGELPPLQTWVSEKRVNPFLRLDDEDLWRALQKHDPELGRDPASVFYLLRELRNRWRGEP